MKDEIMLDHAHTLFSHLSSEMKTPSLVEACKHFVQCCDFDIHELPDDLFDEVMFEIESEQAEETMMRWAEDEYFDRLAQ